MSTKHPLRSVLVLSAMLLPSAAFPLPAETFDILSFTPPAGWENTLVQNDHVQYTGYNAKRTEYCQFAVYASRPSAGDPLRDFQDEWNGFILKSQSIALTGKPEIAALGNGWTIVKAATPIKVKNLNPFTAMLISFTGSGRVTSVLINVSDKGLFGDAIVSFTGSITPIDQPTANAPPSTSPASPQSQAADGGKGGTTFIVKNHLSRDIIYLYVKLMTDPSWGPDLLQSTNIPAGGSITFPNMKPGTYELEADTSDHFFKWTSKNDVFAPGGTFTWTVPVN